MATEPSGRTTTIERRFVSILFADLVGFTAISEAHDPEEVRELLSAYFATAREVISGYGGSIEKFIGDAVMAVWGAPVAQEDDAERAVRAALELVTRVRELSLGEHRLELRAAVNSGEAAVTPGHTGEGMVAGDLVNTASRLQSVAPAGTVLVGEATQRATSAAIAYEPAGGHVLKGKQTPVSAWRALRVVARVGGAGRGAALEPPFVGRDEDLRLLKDQLHAVEREHKLRLVSITGQAGVGKSRLAWELEKYLDGLAGQLYYWHQGRSPSYGEGVTFWALGEMVRRRCGIAEGEGGPGTRDKLRATLAEFVPEPVERRWLEPALGALLGIDEADLDAREQLFSAWRTFFERIAERGPTVLVFEDIQWADTGLLDFIEHVLEWTRNSPILVVTLARPEILDRRPGWGVGHRALVGLHLEPLPDEAMEELLRGVVPGMPEDDLKRIVARAEGVPLYAMETVRSLLDGGYLERRDDAYALVRDLPALDIPPTLQALIASRLDALEPADRTLVQDASVLGVVFALPVLAGLTGRPVEDVESRLRALAQREVVALEMDPRSPERGQYRFVQGLIREVAYGTLGRRDRRARHLAVARHYETLSDEEVAGVLAGHYLEAYRAAPEGPEGLAVAAQARVALKAAAERATRLHSHEQAVAYYQQALAVTFDEADQAVLHISAARSARAAGLLQLTEEHLRVALAMYEREGDHGRVGATAAMLGEVLLTGSHIDEGMEVLEAALAVLPADATVAAIDLNGQLARGYLFRHRSAAALTAVSHALDAAEESGLRATIPHLLITKSWSLIELRHPREATALLLGAMRMADDQRDLSARVRSRLNLSNYLASDDPNAALSIAEEGLALARQYGLGFHISALAGNAAGIAMWNGDLDRTLAIESSVGEIQNALSAAARGWAASAASLRGDESDARDRLGVVAELTSDSTSSQDLAGYRCMQAIVALGSGALVDASHHGHAAREAFAEGDGFLGTVVAGHAELLLGDREALRGDIEFLERNAIFGVWLDRSRRTLEAGILALDGRPEEADAAYRIVINEWRSDGLRLDLAIALIERAWLLGADHAEAAAGRDEARTILDEMGATGFLERLEAHAVKGNAGPAAEHRHRDTERVVH